MSPADRRRDPRRWAAAAAFTTALGAGGLTVALTGADEDGPATAHAEVVEVRTIHVAEGGDDEAAGTADAPLRTLGAAIRESGPGDTVMVHTGTYRETLKIENRPGLRLVAAPGAQVWLDGSVVVPEWTPDPSEGRWVATGWEAEFDPSPTYAWGQPDHTQAGWSFVNPEYPMAAHPDQVWVDGERQTQVGSADAVGEGTFYVDTDRDELVLGTDPTGRTVTASAQSRALRVRSPGVLVRGIGVRNYAPSVPHMGAVTVEAPDVTFVDVDVTDMATTGMHVLSHDVTLRDVTIERNGMIGLTATEADGLEAVRLTVRDNNLERFNQSPASGGVKIGRSTGIRIEDSVFAGNLGTGLWFDESSYDIAVLGSQMLDNTGHGLSVEVSGHAVVAGNTVARNAGNGLKLNDAEDVEVWNNTFVDNDRSINVVQDDRDRYPRGTYRDPDLPLTWKTQALAFRNNVLVRTTAAGADGEARTCLLCVEDYSGRWTAAEMDVTALGNVYQRPDADSPRWMVVWSRRDGDPFVFRTLAEFRTTAYQEENGAEFTGSPALAEDLSPLPALERLSASVAQPLPADLAAILGRPVGEQHLGAWPH